MEYQASIRRVWGAEHDRRYSWIFQDVDYIRWFESRVDVEAKDNYSETVTTLVLSGSPILECAVSHMVDQLHDRLFYFFHRSIAQVRYGQKQPI